MRPSPSTRSITQRLSYSAYLTGCHFKAVTTGLMTLFISLPMAACSSNSNINDQDNTQKQVDTPESLTNAEDVPVSEEMTEQEIKQAKMEKALKRAIHENGKLNSKLKRQDDAIADMYSALVKTATQLIIQRYIPSASLSSASIGDTNQFPISKHRDEINQLVYILYGDNSKSMATRREILKRITRLEIRDYLATPHYPINEFDLLLTQASKYDGRIKRQYFPAFLTALYSVHGKRPEDTQIWYPYLDWLLEMVEEEKEGILPPNEDYFLQLIIRFNNGE